MLSSEHDREGNVRVRAHRLLGSQLSQICILDLLVGLDKHEIVLVLAGTFLVCVVRSSLSLIRYLLFEIDIHARLFIVTV
jgi:hypothetical protein